MQDIKPGGFRLGCIVGWQQEYTAQMSYQDCVTVTATQEAELVLNTLYNTLQLVDELEQEVTKYV